jgi:hypothetical protein
MSKLISAASVEENPFRYFKTSPEIIRLAEMISAHETAQSGRIASNGFQAW